MTDLNARTRRTRRTQPLRVPTPDSAPPPYPPRRGRGAPVPEAEGTNPVRLAVLGGLVLLAGVAGGWPLLLMIVALVVMIFLHELGHYLTAKWAGMKVTEFFIGFGPRIWSFRRGETEYGVKAIPAGAYVKIIGMNNLDEFDPADAERTYMSKPFWRRISVAVAGSTMHFLLAALCFFVAFAGVGVPGGVLPFSDADLDALEASVPWTVKTVSDDSAAAAAGVEVGDRIVSIDGIEVPTFEDFAAAVTPRAGDTVDVVLERDGASRTVEATIGDREGTGFFGVGYRFSLAELPNERSGVLDAVGDTGDAYLESIGQTFGGLAEILSPSGIADLGQAAFGPDDDPGPVVGGGGSGDAGRDSSERSDETQAAGIIRISDIGADLLDDGQFGYWLAVFATINIFIGIFNLVPLLPLDGGHVAIAVYEKIQAMRKGVSRYHVDAARLLPVTFAVVVVLAFLTVSILVLDTRTVVGG